jgi:hypothetical protein
LLVGWHDGAHKLSPPPAHDHTDQERCRLAVVGAFQREQTLDWLNTAVDDGRADRKPKHALEREIDAWDMSCRIMFIVQISGYLAAIHRGVFHGSDRASVCDRDFSTAPFYVSFAQKLVDPDKVAPEYRAAAEKRRAEQIKVAECSHKADEAKVLPRDRTAHIQHCLDEQSASPIIDRDE